MHQSDTTLYIVIETPNIAATILNGDLCNISDWADFLLVNFNAVKTLSMVISRKVNKPIHPPPFMNNTQIDETQTHKHLGIPSPVPVFGLIILVPFAKKHR